MNNILIYFIIGSFLALLFLNVYFRVKVMKVYKKLVKDDVKFDASHIFSQEKMEREVLPYYPERRADILLFVKLMKRSLNIALILIVLITLAGLIIQRGG